MLAEHTLVTTLEAPDAVRLAREFLCVYGFNEVRREEHALHAARGRAKPNQSISVSDLPQSVVMRYDRGRIELAVAVTEPKKVEAAHRDLALALLDGLYQLLAHDGRPDEAHLRMEAVERDNALSFRRRRRRRWIIVGLLIGFLVFWVILIASLI